MIEHFTTGEVSFTRMRMPLPPADDVDAVALKIALQDLRTWRQEEISSLPSRVSALYSYDPHTFSILHDPLSGHFCQNAEVRSAESRSIREFDALNSTGWPTLEEALKTEDSFVEMLLAMQEKCSPENAKVRSGRMLSGPDGDGHAKLFPRPEDFPSLWHEALDRVKRLRERCPVMAAVVLHKYILVVHPFPDGNGRVSRIVLNWALRSAIPNFDYLPMYEVRQYSRGGWLLSLRRVEIRDDWPALVSYLANTAIIAKRLQADNFSSP